MIRKIRDSLLTLAYPQACQICEQTVEAAADGIVCRECWTKTRIFRGDETVCQKCGRFLSDKPARFETFCHLCDGHFYDAARAAGKYEKGLSASILNLKREPFIPATLRKLFIGSFYRTSFQNAARIIPVPLSARRQFERGFNQASILARVLARETGIAADERSLVRTKHADIHRAGMDRKGREMSVAKAFEVRRGNLIEGETILLIDDVFTSGATASVCAKVLKEKGADRVYVFTLARTT
jgi:ComF family protein